MNSDKSLLIGTIGLGAVAIVCTLLWRRSPAEVVPTAPSANVETTASTPALSQLSPVARETPAGATPTPSDPAARSAEPVLTPEQTWEAKYSGLSSTRLKELRDELQRDLGQRSEPALKKLYDAGHFEVVGEGTKHTLTREESDLSGLLSLVMVPKTESNPNGETRRVVLPENQFPELYAINREVRWLDKRYRELDLDEDLAKQKTIRPPR